jgi:hypothetical protein
MQETGNYIRFIAVIMLEARCKHRDRRLQRPPFYQLTSGISCALKLNIDGHISRHAILLLLIHQTVSFGHQIING